MTILVSVETILLALMLVLVAGLLRSHAEILRRLESRGEAAGRPPGPEVIPRRSSGAPAHDITGTTLDRKSLGLAIEGTEHDTLIAFLTSGCTTCRGFWNSFRARPIEIPGGARVVVATHDPSHESPSKLRSLAPDDIPVVMSSEAWDLYQVPMSPYFVYVNGPDAAIAGEGTAQTWDQVLSLVRDALLDQGDPSGSRPAERWSRADQELAAAGITAEHPSLYEADDPAIVEGLDVIN